MRIFRGSEATDGSNQDFGAGPWDVAELRAEIDQLSEALRRHPDAKRERHLLGLRHRAGIAVLEDGASRPRPAKPAPDGPVGSGPVPEVSPSELSPGVLRAAILQAGCLLVRELIPRRSAERLAGQINRAFEHRERQREGRRFDQHLYSEFEADGRFEEPIARQWIKSGGGLLTVDSPGLSFTLFELLAEAGLADLAEGYLGEPPLIAADKSTLRRAEPSVGGGWHQDGKFMGEVNALNLWLSLSHCGDTAPGLDLVPRRLEHHVTTQTDEAWLDNMVSQRMAIEAAGETGIIRPIFEPGDALLFDDLFLHKTASEPDMPQPRFAVENWFFGPSGFPAGYIPLNVR
jgi:hypothetical protein